VADEGGGMSWPWLVETSDGRVRHFPTFEAAERWARKAVAKSGSERFAIDADIFGPDERTSLRRQRASVRLDGCDRVWTDLREPAA
jgi:hypothetical protein